MCSNTFLNAVLSHPPSLHVGEIVAMHEHYKAIMFSNKLRAHIPTQCSNYMFGTAGAFTATCETTSSSTKRSYSPPYRRPRSRQTTSNSM